MRLSLLLAIAVLAPAALRAEDPPASLSRNKEGLAFFEQKIRPRLVEHCYSCHSRKSDKVKGGLLLDTKSGWQRGGEGGKPAIVPGKPAESPLIQAWHHLGGLEMPPKTKLPDAAIADFVAWVRMGAPDPRDDKQVEAKRADKSWWSLQPIGRPSPPAVKDAGWNRHPIDRFVFGKLAEMKLTPNPPAEARALIRRMSYDVIGLPPSAEEVEAFAVEYAKDRNRAVEGLVDRLLASPHYGEQWGRHWLDVVRFGESNGFERNFVIDDLWPFRDYIIKSFNDDKPFNRLIVEHLAGDVIGRDDPAVEVGTAFLVAGPFDDVGNQDVVAQKNIRAQTLDDIITATGSAFLGLTVNCARCHHHKFDPIPTEDYYRLRAAFEGVTHGRRIVATAEERAKLTTATRSLNEMRSRIVADLATIEKAIQQRASAELARRKFARPRVDPQLTEEGFAPTEARFVKFVIMANTANPKSGAGAGRLTEFEVWSAGEKPRNVALASNGGRADGARSAIAEDFPEAYGPQLCIDGKFGEQWFIGSPAELTITLARTESIDRIAFSNAKGRNIADKAQGATPCEYEVRVSMDGKNWRTVASSSDRAPWSPAHGVERVLREVTTPDEASRLGELRKQVAEVDRKLRAIPPLRQIWAGNFHQPAERTFVHKGGDPTKPLAAVFPSSMEVLGDAAKPFQLAANAPEGQRRLALARWIAADDNPLTARVLANRVWHYHFGTGIVDTPSDFGFLGGKPTHPELLDWLAARLIHHGWRLKPLHREILLSNTYQQSATFRPEAARMDKDARYLWRFPPRRLSAEEIRDNMLVVAGKLNATPGGPGFRLYKYTQNNVSTYFPLDKHGPETWRRAVYHQNARASVVDLLNDFDLPDTAFAAPHRASTTSPLQALTLLNHHFTLDMAAAVAERAERIAATKTTTAKVEAVYRLALQRKPTTAEIAAARELADKHGLAALCRAMFNLNELIFLE